MLKYSIALLPGLAGGIGFWFLDQFLLKSADPIRYLGMGIAFIILTAGSLWLMRKDNTSSHRISSDRKIGGDSDDKLGNVTIKGGGSTDLLSGNRIKGNSKTEIDRIEIG